MIKYTIYTDGSCRGNGNGGIGVVWLRNDEKVYEYSRGFKNTTNNQMELIAIYVALRSIKRPLNSLEIISDSEYSIGVLTKPWKIKKNIELIAKIKKQLVETQKLVKDPIIWTHVRGHQKIDDIDSIFNNRADFLAQCASENIF